MNTEISGLDKSDSLYFPHTSDNSGIDLFGNGKCWSESDDGNSEKYQDGSDNASCYCYWLASPSSSNIMSLMVAGWATGIINDSQFSFGFCGLRPIVSLESNIKVEWVEETDSNIDNGYYKIVGTN